MSSQEILVITPTLGSRDTLARTIQSVKKIGGALVKHIVITPEKNIEKLKVLYPDTEIVAEPPSEKKGIYPALNYGFEKYGRDYKYLTYINDDDYWLEGFKELIYTIRNNIDVEFVYGKVKFVNENFEIIKKQACSNQFYSFLSLYESNIVLFTQQATLIKSDLFFKLGGFSTDFKLVSDSKLWIDLSLAKPNFRYIPVECAGYMLQEGQLSSDKNLQEKENDQLLKIYNKTSFMRRMYDKILFRALNLGVYLSRLLKS